MYMEEEMTEKDVVELEKELEKAKQEDLTNCATELNVVLEKYGCALDPIVVLSGSGGFESSVRIIKKAGTQ